MALWNGRDPILKERAVWLDRKEGNHGEDVKEYYYYLDNTPSHSFMKYLYKYPQAAFPYAQLVEENQRRNRLDREFELVDTGIFNHDRYFDVVVEYGKVNAEDLLIRISISNRGREAGANSSAAYSLVPQHLELGTRRSSALDRQTEAHWPRSQAT